MITIFEVPFWIPYKQLWLVDGLSFNFKAFLACKEREREREREREIYLIKAIKIEYFQLQANMK